MGHSRVPGALSSGLDPVCLPARTPATLGLNDAADPTANARRGDTPGSLGSNDGADPNSDMAPPFWQSPGPRAFLLAPGAKSESAQIV